MRACALTGGAVRPPRPWRPGSCSNGLALAAGLTTDQRGYGRVCNGVVDIGAFESSSSIPGDINTDGAVNFADLLTLAQHYGVTNATWAQGDLNGDGTVGFDDLLILAQNYGQKSAAAVLTSPPTGPAAATVGEGSWQIPATFPSRRRTVLRRT